MRWILTEDTKSGYDIVKIIADNIIAEPVHVINPTAVFPAGGGTKMYDLLKHLVNKRYIRRGDVVFVMLDNLVKYGNTTDGDIKAQNNIIIKCEALADRKKFKCRISNFLCIEAAMLSFEYLDEFCLCRHTEQNMYTDIYKKYKTNILDNSAQKTKVSKKHCSFTVSDTVSRYSFLCKSGIKGNTLEQKLAKLLEGLTSLYGQSFTAFCFVKNYLGDCWHRDCSEVSGHLRDDQKSFCQICYAAHKAPYEDRANGQQRLTFLVKNSDLADIAEALDATLTA